MMNALVKVESRCDGVVHHGIVVPDFCARPRLPRSRCREQAEVVSSQQNHVTVSVGVVDTINETSSLLEAAGSGVDALLQRYQQNQQAVAAAR